jgi:hypothetical protein
MIEKIASLWCGITDVDIAEKAIQVGGAREGQSFVLKV